MATERLFMTNLNKKLFFSYCNSTVTLILNKLVLANTLQFIIGHTKLQNKISYIHLNSFPINIVKWYATSRNAAINLPYKFY